MSKNDGGAVTPAEILELARKVTDARMAFEVLAMSNANAGNADEKLARKVAFDVASARLQTAETRYYSAVLSLTARDAQ